MPLAVTVHVDRSSVRPDEPTTLAVALALRASSAGPPRERSPLRTVLSIDVSGSMGGEPLQQVVASVERILDVLGDADRLGIASFSDEAARVFESASMDPAGKRAVRAAVGRLRADGRTNVEGGLNTAAAMLGGTGSVILLSDGAPNVGAHTEDALRAVIRRHRPAVSFFALGYGVDHSDAILSAVGDAGGAGYEYVPDPATCARAFARALGAQADVVASGLEIVIAPADGVELVRFVGREDTRFGRHGITVTLPDMVNGAERLVVFELRVRASRDRFLCPLFDVTYRAKVDGVRVEERVDGAIEIADRPALPRIDALARILLARADEARVEARAHADRGQFAGAAASIRKIMADIEATPGWVRNDGSDLAEAYELLVDEATAFESRPSAEAYNAFRKGTVGSKLASAVPSAARSRGDASEKLIRHIAGDVPEAWLVIDGARHPLCEECVIGRTMAAHVRVTSSSVSRRHAEIFANAGDYWVADLGSANATVVNGQRLGHAPHRLVPGDVIVVGDVEMRYEEASRRV